MTNLTNIPTLCAAFQATALVDPDGVALRTVGGTQEVTWREYAERVRSIAAGLAALGVSRGDTVGMMMLNRPEFNLVDTAALHLGATPFSVYNTSSPEQLTHLFANAECRVVVCEDQFLDVIRAVVPDTKVETIVCVDAARADTMSLADLEQAPAPGFDFEAAWRAVEPTDVLTLIYTSGTTGPPKGVELTHASMLAELAATSQILAMLPGDRITSYLPHAHIADRWVCHYASLAFGVQLTTVPDPKAIAAALADVRPTIWGGVPRVWEKLKAALETGGITDPAVLPPEAKAAVLAKIGLDQVRWAVSGAAPIPTEVLEYFLALGVPVLELWGMSELSCCATVNPTDDIRIGTVGKPIPGLELRLADDGEVLVRGATLMKGYRNEPQLTAETIDPDGWLATGDIGTLDEDGYLRIVDRKKELIINAAGKNMSPANIEQVLKTASPLIGQAVVIGDRRPYNVALLVLDPDASAAYAAKRGLAEAAPRALSADAQVREDLAQAVAAANERLSRVEQIKRYHVVPADWEPGGDELTPTSKLKRKPIAEKYADDIEALYTDTDEREPGRKP